MAIQAHMFQENLGLPISSQDYFFMGNNNNINNNNNNLLLNEYGYNNLQHIVLQEQQFQYQQQQYMQRRNSCMKEGSFVFLQPSKKQKLATTTSTTTSEIDSFSTQLEKQRNEIDRYIAIQNEWLKLALQEQRKQQLGVIIKKLEAKAVELLKQKDDQIIEAKNKTIELQEIVRKLEVENQAWKKVALENEEMVFSLNNTLEQIQQQQQQQQDCSSSSSNGVDDCESCYKVSDNKKKEFCKVCKCRNASVLLLPCRHLCCCKDCDVFINACPICKSPKMASIDALIS